MIKSRNEMATVVDRAAELQLAAGLKRIRPGATFIGEDGVEAGTAKVDDISDGAVGLVDPLDGTSNFARGEGSFGVMIAYLVEGKAQDSWLYDPVLSRLCTAKLGGGSYIDGFRVASANRRLEASRGPGNTVHESRRTTSRDHDGRAYYGNNADSSMCRRTLSAAVDR